MMRNYFYSDDSSLSMEDRDAIEKIIVEDCKQKITKLNLDLALENVRQIEE